MTELASPGEAAVELLEQLVAIDSVNPSLTPGAAGETRIVAALKARLVRAGFTTHIVEAAGVAGRPSLVAIGPAAGDVPTVVFNGHLDTVGVDGMVDPFVPRIEDDRLYGRGAADMKGGVAALVVAAERLALRGAPVRPVLSLVADEEDASLGSEAVIAALGELGVHPDLCLIAEPTGLELCRSLRGFGVAQVTFRGIAAHTSQAHLGVNAVTNLGRLLAAVEERAPELHAHNEDLMVTVVRGGSSPFVVPDSAECVVEMRVAPSARVADAFADVQAMLRPEWMATAELVASREGWQLDATGPAADFAANLGEALGTTASFDAPYWMEAPLWQAVCPTVICGPTGDGLHSVEEWVDLDQVRRLTMSLIDVLSAGIVPNR